MPSTRWISAPAGKARRLAARLARRAEPLPRLPFAVALAAAAAVLAVSVEWEPRPPDDIADVSELPSAPEDGIDFTAGSQVEFRILEYGFSVVVDELDQRRIILGAVVYNPFATAMVSPGSLDIVSLREDGTAAYVESFYPDPIPPDTAVQVGYVLSESMAEVPLDSLRLETQEPSFLAPDPAELSPELREFAAVQPLPRIELLSVQPLVSPDGYRIHYRVVSETARTVQLAVLFRDAAGELIGGLPAGEDPFAFELGAAGWRTVQAGETVQEIDLHETWIPEGADLDRIEIGPRSAG
ncbi:hypothetical protein [Glycomyces terrestris]|uniref:Uncharacterized protein n=1 Tax=Glycomyces terrestris TaxID=2493553 RepID=A0A426UTG7_9ACTN|nr:hypothetical protein [Glycomyces terrestris]RRR97304.1 hypothetical protein EIW28_17975 [Glycomyces terrestris]